MIIVGYVLLDAVAEGAMSYRKSKIMIHSHGHKVTCSFKKAKKGRTAGSEARATFSYGKYSSRITGDHRSHRETTRHTGMKR